MVLLRAEKDRKLVQPGLQVLRDAGVSFQRDRRRRGAPDRAGAQPRHRLCRRHPPARRRSRATAASSPCCCKSEAAGAAARSSSSTATVAPLDPAAPGSLHVWTLGDDAPVRRRFDAVVVCGGVDSAALLRPLGLRIPLAAVYGYSISAPIREPLNAPRSAVMDERYKVAISRLGKRVRVAGSAEIGGSPARKSGRPPSRRSTRCCTTGFRARRNLPTPAPACRNGKARGPCCPTVRR